MSFYIVFMIIPLLLGTLVRLWFRKSKGATELAAPFVMSNIKR